MVKIEEEEWYLSICQQLNDFCMKVEEKVHENQQKLMAREERNERKAKIMQERKLNAELTEQCARLSNRTDELARACNKFSKLSITDNDQLRLDNLKEGLEVSKELTGIRFDYSAPQNVIKGYIKSEYRKLLLPFEVDNPEALWSALRTGDCGPRGKENYNPN
ncbi:uncharacterized protein LOC112056021 [Bicyclus anynana]|uniref:Uncharacterized protein LOC112056021 n=1 Tax=Bicyclus anynana TaxID=110368 RepID=A0A6J1NWX0_BICAN|nr:uncharacterized protein LOC112056021 [Bicyclus anynana]